MLKTKKGHSSHAWTTSQIHLGNRMWLFWAQHGAMIIFVAYCLYLCLSLSTGRKTENKLSGISMFYQLQWTRVSHKVIGQWDTFSRFSGCASLRYSCKLTFIPERKTRTAKKKKNPRNNFHSADFRKYFFSHINVFFL